MTIKRTLVLLALIALGFLGHFVYEAWSGYNKIRRINEETIVQMMVAPIPNLADKKERMCSEDSGESMNLLRKHLPLEVRDSGLLYYAYLYSFRMPGFSWTDMKANESNSILGVSRLLMVGGVHKNLVYMDSREKPTALWYYVEDCPDSVAIYIRDQDKLLFKVYE